MRKNRLLLLLLAMMTAMILFACTETKTSDFESDNSPVSGQEEISGEVLCSPTESQDFSDASGTSIDVLREEIDQVQAMFGMAYIGCFDDYSDMNFEEWLNDATAPLSEYYPFISEIDQTHIIGTEGHLYCVIARDYDSNVSVNRIKNDEILYRSENGDPILVFCNRDGDAHRADIVVTIKIADGREYRWEPTLDDFGCPNILVGDERALLSLDFGNLHSDEGFDFEAWKAEGWNGVTACGLAYDEIGTSWWYTTWDQSKQYCLTFYLNNDENDCYSATLECFYADDLTLQAKWQGQWYVETELDQPSSLYVNWSLTDGADREAFEKNAVVSESYLALVPLSGNELLLVAEGDGADLPLFPDGAQAVQLILAEG